MEKISTNMKIIYKTNLLKPRWKGKYRKMDNIKRRIKKEKILMKKWRGIPMKGTNKPEEHMET